MGLWLEHRDENGNLFDRARFFGGIVMLHGMTDGDESDEPLILTIEQAQDLAKPSNGLPLEKRDWVLRLSFDD